MNWFERLTGTEESSPRQVRQSLEVHDGRLHCPNGKDYGIGRLETPSLKELRIQTGAPESTGKISFRERVADVVELHADPSNRHSVFQVASQFNLLEMVDPSVSPDQGIGRYEFDRTQGPACAIACGAGTVFRNYFVPLAGQLGQSSTRQIDCSDALGKQLGNDRERLWSVRNGYLLPSANGLREISDLLHSASPPTLDQLKELLKIGLQTDVQVTAKECEHTVTQVYCSALPVSYSGFSADRWEPFARLVLQSAYEATFRAAELNRRRTGCNRLFLTLLGGGAFGNPAPWITDAIEQAARSCAEYPLEVSVVSYRHPNPAVAQLVHRLDQ